MSRPYPSYRESGEEWLGDVPEDWGLTRLKFVARLNPAASVARKLDPDTEVSFVPMEAVGEYGGLDLSQTARLSDVAEGYTYFGNRDVVVAKITPCFENWKGALATGLVNGVAFGTTELHVLRCRGRVDERFLLYLTFSDAFRSLGVAEMSGAAGQKRVPKSFLENFTPAIPSLAEQRAIAAFLDRETERIDALVDKKRQLIERLQEYRTALITRTVTRGLPPEAARAAGLDPSPRLKPSGVEWLGNVPEHWEVTRLARVIDCLDGKRIPLNAEARAEYQGGYPYWGANGILDHVEGWLFDEPLVLLGEDGSPFFAANKRVAFSVSGKIWVNNHAHVLRPVGVHQDCLTHMLNITEYAYFIDGSTRDKLTQGQMNAIPVVLPPLDEQHAIAVFLDSETGRIDALCKKAETAIERLQEHRTAIITAAVTGKIDVREVAPEPVAAAMG